MKVLVPTYCLMLNQVSVWSFLQMANVLILRILQTREKFKLKAQGKIVIL